MTSVASLPNRSTRCRTRSTLSARQALHDARSCQVTKSLIGRRTRVSLRFDVCIPSGISRTLKGELSRIGRRSDHVEAGCVERGGKVPPSRTDNVGRAATGVEHGFV